jgi:hypothetical protein
LGDIADFEIVVLVAWHGFGGGLGDRLTIYHLVVVVPIWIAAGLIAAVSTSVVVGAAGEAAGAAVEVSIAAEVVMVVSPAQLVIAVFLVDSGWETWIGAVGSVAATTMLSVLVAWAMAFEVTTVWVYY